MSYHPKSFAARAGLVPPSAIRVSDPQPREDDMYTSPYQSIHARAMMEMNESLAREAEADELVTLWAHNAQVAGLEGSISPEEWIGPRRPHRNTGNKSSSNLKMKAARYPRELSVEDYAAMGVEPLDPRKMSTSGLVNFIRMPPKQASLERPIQPYHGNCPGSYTKPYNSNKSSFEEFMAMDVHPLDPNRMSANGYPNYGHALGNQESQQHLIKDSASSTALSVGYKISDSDIGNPFSIYQPTTPLSYCSGVDMVVKGKKSDIWSPTTPNGYMRKRSGVLSSPSATPTKYAGVIGEERMRMSSVSSTGYQYK